MAGSQQQFDFSDAARLERHLRECGLSELQAALCGLILREGTERREEDQVFYTLRISQRKAATRLRGTPSGLRKAAGRVATLGLLRIIQESTGRETLYVLNALAARALVRTEDRLDEFTARVVSAQRGRAHHLGTCAPGGHPVRTAPLVLGESLLKPPCHLVPEPSQGVPGDAVRRGTHPGQSGAQQDTPRVAGSADLGPGGGRQLAAIAMPWSRQSGFTNAELRAAVHALDLAGLRHVFDEAMCGPWSPDGRRGIDDDRWLRFLTCVHRRVRTGGRCLRALLQLDVKQKLDVTRCSQADDDWAGRMAARAWRDPQLARSE